MRPADATLATRTGPDRTPEASRVLEAARAARAAASVLAGLTTAQRNAAVHAVSDALTAAAGFLLEANAEDVRAAEQAVDAGTMSPALLGRLHLDAGKLSTVIAGVRRVAALEDPVGRVTLRTELDEGLQLTRISCPIGVVGVVFESRPDALPQIVALCLKSGNAVLLKGGSEAARSNRALVRAIALAVETAGLPAAAVTLLEGRAAVETLLTADHDVDLIVPRGSGALVRWVQDHTRIPVLGHAEGVCHVYVDRAADLERALAIVTDAKCQYPAACNAAETLLVHADVADRFLPRITAALDARGVAIRTDPDSWGVEFGDLVLAVRVVDTLDDAIAHINRYGSHHTDGIVTEEAEAAARFLAAVDSAGVFHNVSTRFADGFRYGFGAEVGISTGKLHPRGPVGLDGLVTYKYVVAGAGHVVAAYEGPGARRFRHTPAGPGGLARHAATAY